MHTSASERPADELLDLVAQLRDERLDAAGCAALEALLHRDRQARRTYIQYMTLVAGLEWHVGALQGPPGTADADAALPDNDDLVAPGTLWPWPESLPVESPPKVSADGSAPAPPSGGATSPSGGATAPDGGASAPSGGATTPDGGASAPDGGASAPSGGASAPSGGATSPAHSLNSLGPPGAVGPCEADVPPPIASVTSGGRGTSAIVRSSPSPPTQRSWLERRLEDTTWLDAAPLVLFGLLMFVVGAWVGTHWMAQPAQVALDSHAPFASAPTGEHEAAPHGAAPEPLAAAADSAAQPPGSDAGHLDAGRLADSAIAADLPEGGVAGDAPLDAHSASGAGPASPGPIATLIAASGCRWESSSLPTVTGARLTRGTLHLAEGLAELRFASGAVVVLEGPTIFELATADHTHLHRGRLTARVPPAAIGFRVDTPAASVVDLGTSFGLRIDESGATEVHVFTGLVELRPLPPVSHSDPDADNDEPAEQPADESAPASPSSATLRAATTLRRLTAGQAVAMHAGQAAEAWRDVPLAPTQFAHRVPDVHTDDETGGWRTLWVDRFAAPLVDPTRWRISLPLNVPAAAVEIFEGQVRLSNRGHLVSREEFDPRALGGLRIRGRWRPLTDGDLLQVATRSSGEPDAAMADVAQGIVCMANMADLGGFITIFGRGGAIVSSDALVRPMRIDAGQEYQFEVVDDGRQVEFTVVKVGAADAASNLGAADAVARVRAMSPTAMPTNYIVIYNRERGATSRVALLDDIELAVGAAEASETAGGNRPAE